MPIEDDYRVSRAVAVAAWFARTSASSAPTSAVAVGVPNSVSGSASGSGGRSGLAPDTEARRRRGVLLGIQNLAAKAEDKEQLFDAKGFASAARDSLLDVRGVAGPPARGGGLRSFPGGATPANCCQRRPQGDTATI